MATLNDPQWPRASDWLAKGSHDPRLVVLGVPLNASLSPGACHLAPGAIRQALSMFGTLHCSSNDSHLHSADLAGVAVADIGDLPSDLKPEQTPQLVREALARFERAEVFAFLGGDNSVTRPGVLALGDPQRVGLLTLDAHLDVRSLEGGLHNGNPVRALIEDGLKPQNVRQVGIQSFANSPQYMEWARGKGAVPCPIEGGDFQAEVLTALKVLDARCDAIYVNVDLDVLDRAFAPACPGARPGGITPREMFAAIAAIGRNHKVRAFDLVELDPERDINQCTALTAAKCLLCFVAAMTHRKPERERTSV